MKFAMNGALTIGTLDGANVEIRDAVGPENFFLFGLTAAEVAAAKAAGYRPRDIYEANAELREAIDLIDAGAFSNGDREMFRPLARVAADPRRLPAVRRLPGLRRLPAARQRGLSRPARTGRACRSSTARASAASRPIARFASTAGTSGTSSRSCRPVEALNDDAARIGPARAPRSARRSTPERGQLQRVLEERRRPRAAALRRRGGAGARRASIRLDPRRAPHLSLLARVRARSRSRARSMPTGRTGRSRRNAASGSTRRRCSSIRTAWRSPCRAATTATPRAARATTARAAMKSVVADPGAYDWEGDRPLRRPFARDLHLRDARARLHAASELRRRADARRGTYAGLIEKIPYLQDLGVTAVELLPVFQFDPLRRAARTA